MYYLHAIRHWIAILLVNSEIQWFRKRIVHLEQENRQLREQVKKLTDYTFDRGE